MKIKLSIAGLIIASTIVVTGPIQAGCMKHTPGWHIVSKHCNIKPAENGKNILAEFILSQYQTKACSSWAQVIFHNVIHYSKNHRVDIK